MKLSSLDIRKQQFSRIVRGYDRDEVDAFLEMVGTQWQELIDDSRRNEEKITEMHVKLEHYQKVEEALEEAIKSARDNAEKKIKNAEKSATAVLEKAEARAVKITIGAEEERLKIKRETARYSIRQKDMLAKFRSFLTSELEMLAYHEKNDTLRVPEQVEPHEKEFEVHDPLAFEESSHDSADASEIDTAEPEQVAVEIDSGEPEQVAVEIDSGESEKHAAKSQDISDSSDKQSDGPDDESNDVPSESQEASTDATEAPSEESSVASDEQAELAPSEQPEDDVDQKSSWTVNTLVSPDSEDEDADNTVSAEPDRTATPPKGDMRAAQEEIDNLRKLLKDLE